jgi:hypothetical protein
MWYLTMKFLIMITHAKLLHTTMKCVQPFFLLVVIFSQRLFKENVYIWSSFAFECFPFLMMTNFNLTKLKKSLFKKTKKEWQINYLFFVQWVFIYVHWSINDVTVLISTHQCFQLQNLLCDYNKLQSHKWFNIAIIIILVLLHMYKNIYAHTHKHIQINHTIIYVLYTYINAQHLIYWQGQHVCDALFHTRDPTPIWHPLLDTYTTVLLLQSIQYSSHTLCHSMHVLHSAWSCPPEASHALGAVVTRSGWILSFVSTICAVHIALKFISTRKPMGPLWKDFANRNVAAILVFKHLCGSKISCLAHLLSYLLKEMLATHTVKCSITVDCTVAELL